eukprot:Rhum_TRINITY_DN13738_c0_g2::Rhum_TRINITY_DN13738_c0_g2_i1::g.63512::m.63512
MNSDALPWKPVEKESLLGPLHLATGDVVSLHGLKAMAALNGQEGTVRSWEAPRGRYSVETAQGKLMAFKPANMIPLYLRVDGKRAAAGDPNAHFLALPLALAEALRWEDDTQLLSNTHAVESNKRCKHLAECNKLSLEVRPSLIEGAGNGVFALETLAKGEPVTQFSGVWRPADSVGSEAYSQRTSEGLIEGDRAAQSVAGGVAHLINDIACIDKSCDALGYLNSSNAGRNVAMAVVDGVVVAVALRDIAKGEELYHSYGVAYWLGRLQRAALLSHDLELARRCDAQWEEHSKTERIMLESGNQAVSWRSTPSLSISDDFQLLDNKTGKTASAFACRQFCWSRLGVESFALSSPQKGAFECHVLAACALLLNIPPQRIPAWCMENC